MTRTVILFNPSAGKGAALERKSRLEALLRERGVAHETIVTDSEAHLRSLASRLSREVGPDGILAGAGGDSTFHIMAGEIVRTGTGEAPRFAMIGVGSSNDIPLAFGLETMEKAVAALARGTARPIDLGEVSTGRGEPTLFLGQANVGLGAYVNRYVEDVAARDPAAARRQWTTGFRGVRAAYRTRAIPLPLTIESGAGAVEGEFDVAVFGNTAYWATGRLFNPEARADDGILDACLVRHVPFLRLLRVAFLSRSGRHGRDPRVSFLRSSAFRVRSERPFAIQTDGEIVGGGAGEASLVREAVVRISPRTLRLVV